MPTSQQLLEFVQGASGTGLCWLDAASGALQCDALTAQLLGLPPTPAATWPALLGCLAEPSRRPLAAAVEAARAGERELFEMLVHVGDDARRFQPLRLSGRALRGADRRIESVLMALRPAPPVIEPVLEHAIAAAGLGLWELDLDSGTERWSAQTLAMYGLPPEAAPPTRQQWRDRYLHPDDAQAQAERAAAFLAGDGRPYEMDYRIRRVDGSVRWLHTRAALLPGPGRMMIGLSMDITDRKEAELHAAEAWQLLDLSAAQVGFGFGYRDRNQGRGHWSSQLKQIFGLPATAPTPARDQLLQWVAPSSRAVFESQWRRDARVGEVFEYRFDILRPGDGARRTLFTRSVWLADTSDQPWRLCFATVDLTDQLARDRFLNEVQQRLQLATRALGIGTWERDIDAERGRWDDTTLALFGLPAGAPAPTTEEYVALIHPEDREWMISQYHPERTAESADLDFTFRVQLPGGQVRWLHILGGGERDAGGRVVRRVGICMDVTGRRAAEEALRAKELAERANQAKTEFLSRMSHELRTPLNAVLGFAQLMALDEIAPLPAAHRQRLQHVQDAGWHLLSLIDDVLDLSSVEQRQARLQPEWVVLGDVVHEVLALNEPAAALRRITLRWRPPVGALVLWCDRRRLKQVLVNLVSNAVKYNRVGGDVEVGAEELETSHVVHVRDTGCGIDPVRMPELFQPFNRLGREHGGTPGSGIGLALSHNIAELMGGRLQARSELGVGSEFWLELPRPAREASGR